AHIDVEWRVHTPDAEKSHKQALTNIEAPGVAAGGERKPDPDHHGAENDGPSHPDLFRDMAHDDAADSEPEPRERCCQGGNRPQAGRLGCDRLERHDGDPRRSERQRQDHQHDRGDGPGGSGFDRLQADGAVHYFFTLLGRQGADVVAGAAPRVANVEKMTPLYRLESARTTARMSTAKG